MTLSRPRRPDALRPTEEQALAAWAARVRADREQVDRCREVEDPTDFWTSLASRFRRDPNREDDVTLDVLRAMTCAGDTWLDIGAGGGRFALPLALKAARVHVVEPSPSMLEVLRAGMRESDIRNIDIRQGRWPLDDAEPPTADLALMAHIGYDIEDIGAFLDAMEAATTRRCVAVMGEVSGNTAARRFWQDVHGEERILLPAAPEMLALLLARGRLPAVTVVERYASVFESFDDLYAMLQRQLWVRPGSSKDGRLRAALEASATERAGEWACDWSPIAVAIMSWEPARSRPTS
jgi:hypothetical protein